MQHASCRRLTALLTLAALLPLGLAIRFAHFGLPHFLTKYGPSALWAAGIYCLTVAVVPRLTPTRVAAIAFALSTGVEFFKLVRSPELDAFRHTLAGKVLLGRFFSLRDLVAYAAAILLCLAADIVVTRRS